MILKFCLSHDVYPSYTHLSLDMPSMPSLLLIEFEKLQSKSFGDSIDLLLVFALTFEKECEVGNEQHAAEECEEDPEGRKGDYVDE